MTWTYFPHYWPFVWRIHGSPHNGSVMWIFLISLIIAKSNQLPVIWDTMMLMWHTLIPSWVPWGGWGCEVSSGEHHRLRGKTTTGSALGAVFDIAQILAYLVHNMSRSQLHLGFGHFGWLPSFFSVNNILAGLWLNCISSVEITLFLLADILLQHRALFQCYGLVKSF